MNVLVINGSCLSVNSSANLCHLSYLQGLVDTGIQVSLLSASPLGRHTDTMMKIPDGIDCHYVQAISLYERLSLAKMKHSGKQKQETASVAAESSGSVLRPLIRQIKNCVQALYGPHGIEKAFYNKGRNFTCDCAFDFVISISHPTVSHLTAYQLLKTKRIKAAHWIQIWEDPWYADAYGLNKKKAILNEERRLLSVAEKVCYVSPLTLRNQQQLFPESAKKMFWQPLPSYYKSEKTTEKEHSRNCYSYFGDYIPAARDLRPFYEAAREVGIEVNICGNPFGLFQGTDNIHIYPRLSLSELKPLEDSTNVLVFLCNRKGGQIPGKIYQYSATDKTILFILDGTVDEQDVLKEYFGRFNRYIFCQNTASDIARAIQQIEAGAVGSTQNLPLDNFEPGKVVTAILEAGR